MARGSWVDERQWRAYRRQIEAMRRPDLVDSLEHEARLRGAAVQLARAPSDGAG